MKIKEPLSRFLKKLKRLWKKEKPREWTSEERERWTRITPILQELSDILPHTKVFDAPEGYLEMEECAGIIEKLLFAITQDSRDTLESGDPEVLLRTLERKVKELQKEWGHPSLMKFQELFPEKSTTWW
jgi:hypothetical protein